MMSVMTANVKKIAVSLYCLWLLHVCCTVAAADIFWLQAEERTRYAFDGSAEREVVLMRGKESLPSALQHSLRVGMWLKERRGEEKYFPLVVEKKLDDKRREILYVRAESPVSAVCTVVAELAAAEGSAFAQSDFTLYGDAWNKEGFRSGGTYGAAVPRRFFLQRDRMNPEIGLEYAGDIAPETVCDVFDAVGQAEEATISVEKNGAFIYRFSPAAKFALTDDNRSTRKTFALRSKLSAGEFYTATFTADVEQPRYMYSSRTQGTALFLAAVALTAAGVVLYRRKTADDGR